MAALPASSLASLKPRQANSTAGPVSPSPDVSNPSSQQVTNSEAFTTGAGNTNNANIDDGTGNGGSDTYNCYYGGWENFPPSSEWIEFDDMFNNAKSVSLETQKT